MLCQTDCDAHDANGQRFSQLFPPYQRELYAGQIAHRACKCLRSIYGKLADTSLFIVDDAASGDIHSNTIPQHPTLRFHRRIPLPMEERMYRTVDIVIPIRNSVNEEMNASAGKDMSTGA